MLIFKTEPPSPYRRFSSPPSLSFLSIPFLLCILFLVSSSTGFPPSPLFIPSWLFLHFRTACSTPPVSSSSSASSLDVSLCGGSLVPLACCTPPVTALRGKLTLTLESVSFQLWSSPGVSFSSVGLFCSPGFFFYSSSLLLFGGFTSLLCRQLYSSTPGSPPLDACSTPPISFSSSRV